VYGFGATMDECMLEPEIFSDGIRGKGNLSHLIGKRALTLAHTRDECA